MSQSDLNAQIESVAKALPSGAQQDFRTLMTSTHDQITYLSPGGNWLRAGGVANRSSAAPTGVTLSAEGSNGVFTLRISNPNPSVAGVYYEVSYSTVKAFTSGVTTLAASAATSVTLNLPGATLFFRVRASYDRVNWSPYASAGNTAIASGLVSSAAVSNGGAFNQTNFLNVDSVAVGSTASVRVYGTAGPLFSGPSQKGARQVTLPSATIINVTPASTRFVGWNGRNYVLQSTLAAVLGDDLTPVGKVNVVGTGAPHLPTIKAILSSGGIIGYNVTDGGAGATADYVLTITDGSGEHGAGATAGAQTFSGGVLQAVGPGNPGSNYGANTLVTPSGGTGVFAPGGGTAIGGNGGRLTAV